MSDAEPTPRPSRRRWLLPLGAVVLAAAVFVAYWFQPQALLFDRTVDDAFPVAEPTAAPAPTEAMTEEAMTEGAMADEAAADEPAADPAPPEPEPEPTAAPEPVALRGGEFTGRGRYDTSGTATVYDLGDGRRVLRLEDFATTNGPDLLVYLTTAAADAPDAEQDADFIDLGDLRGNVGDQNYELPADVDLDTYGTVVIWCRRFTVGFGTAPLDPVS